MLMLYCSDPLHPRKPDPSYAAEVVAASRLDLPYALVDFEALVHGDALKAVRTVPEQPVATLCIYRGWMLRPAHYAQLFQALADRSVVLINDPVAYRYCHYLPESYAAIADYTPRTAWLRTSLNVDMDRVLDLVRPFGSAPLLVKDFVRSRKYEWDEACYIPSAADRPAIERVVSRFLQLQGDDLEEGLVFRQFIEFEPIGTHARSGMPLVKEYRVFFLDGAPLLSAPYWEEGDYGADSPPLEHLVTIARAIPSRFFTMDIAQRRGGEWMIVELGDGQVAGLPGSVDAWTFYQTLDMNVSRSPR